MPNEEVYVAFKFTAAEGYSTPTVEDVFDGFYIKYPFDTKDYSDLISYDSRLRPVQRVNPHGRFVVGSLLSGVPGLDSSRRIVFIDMMAFDTDITVRISAGFKCGFHIFVDGEFASDSGWRQGSYNIAAGTTFKFIVARVSEQAETEENWWMDFVRAVTF
jgi:hypothetical protein